MSTPLYENGLQGLADSKHAGPPGSAYRIVGVDYRQTPGIMKAQQALVKSSPDSGGNDVNELCKVGLKLSDGSTLWFSSTSGKIWREVSGTWTLKHTTVPTSGGAACLDAAEFDGDVYWSTENYVHKIRVADVNDTWSDVVHENFGAFKNGDDTYHPMQVQNLQLFIGDKYNIAKVENPNDDPSPLSTMGVSLGTACRSFMAGALVNPTDSRFPVLKDSARATSASGASITDSFEVTPGNDRLLVVFAWAWRTDNTTPASLTGITFDGNAMSSRGGGWANLGDNNRARYAIYYLANPDVTTGDIVASFGGTETNLVLQTFLFNGADGLSDKQSEAVNTDELTNELTHTESEDYQTRLASVYSETSTHTHTAGQTEVHNSSNDVGQDSSSYLGTSTGGFQEATDLYIKRPERITTLIDFDVDLLIGTVNVNKARVLRWDTVSESWSAEDSIEESGVNAFIRDDNYVYAQIGDYGRLYYYNGEKMEPYKRIPGDWGSGKTAKVHARSVGFLLGVPVFGLSNVAGNPTLQGVYGFGGYSRDYAKTLSLDFPVSTGEFSSVSIGAIVTDGPDMWVAWSDGVDSGVAKLDYTTKYGDAYIETTMLKALKERSDITSVERYFCDYVSLPASTDMTIGVKSKYEASFKTLTSNNDAKRMQVRAEHNTPQIANLQIRYGFTTNANDSPEIENFAIE